jgi:protein subunit release factor A
MKLKIQYRAFNSGGKGGQHGNRSMNAIQAWVDLPDGRRISATSTMKSQHTSRKMARALLLTRVKAAFDKQKPRVVGGERVRTYHEADNRVTDHASGLVVPFRSLDKRFGDLIRARHEKVLVDSIGDD